MPFAPSMRDVRRAAPRGCRDAFKLDFASLVVSQQRLGDSCCLLRRVVVRRMGVIRNRVFLVIIDGVRKLIGRSRHIRVGAAGGQGTLEEPPPPPVFAMPETDALASALAGDETGFNRLVEPHRGGLHAHCYRMLGSAHDAEDAFQDTLLRAWRGLPGVEKGRSIRPWLYKIATNVCLDEIARRPRRSLPLDHGLLVDRAAYAGDERHSSIRFEPCPDEHLGMEGGFPSPEARYELREALELAFFTALQHLSGRQRAILVLRAVLAFSAREVADLLKTSVAAVNALRSHGDDGIRDLVQRFVGAVEAGDIDGILGLLAEDATAAMPPDASWKLRSRDHVADVVG
jgi:RNA polymerase sigma-70 factor, ECF subfamily